MVEAYVCRRGHRWEPSGADQTLDLNGPPPCPVCGDALGTPPGEVETLAGATYSTTAPLAHAPQIPGYELQEVLGKGGMGIVYRARQRELNRTVAIKQILPAAALAAEQLLRFQIEAETLAAMEHPHVVQVFDAGEQGGQPYLVMEYVNGRSLEDRMRQERLSHTAAATLVETLARTMHAAHQRGIIHRDLKPANILLTAEGTPKITDFGLAKRLNDDVASTRAGALLGTPRYMAPEQAAADPLRVGPPADIHALGTILYELLAGSPVFPSESVFEVLRQIQEVEPTPPRQVVPGLPRDLETICLKCLAKEPARRYSTAGELADDLRCFLDGLPIRARHVGRGERLWLWARRRPLIAALGAAVAALALLSVTGGVWYQVQLVRERDSAQRRFALASQAVDQMLAEIGDEQLIVEPHMEQRRRALLETALRFCLALTQEEPTDFATRRQLGFAYRRLGDIHRLMGAFADAEAAYGKAIRNLELLDRHEPGDLEVARQLAAAHTFAGELFRTSGRSPEALQAYRAAEQILQPLAERADAPDLQADLARTYYNLGLLAKGSDRLAEAGEYFRRAIDILSATTRRPGAKPAFRQHLARARLNLGTVLRLGGQPEPAEEYYTLARNEFQALMDEQPYVTDYPFELALCFNNLGNLHSQQGDLERAGLDLQQAWNLLKKLATDYPAIQRFHQEFANTSNGLAAVMAAQSRLEEAGLRWEEAASSLQRLHAASVGTPATHADRGMCLGNLGRLRLMQRAYPQARQLLAEALKEMEPALHTQPHHPSYRSAALNQCRDLAASLIREQRFQDVRQTAAGLETRFDPSLAPLLQLAIYDRSLGELSNQKELAEPERDRQQREFTQAAQRVLQQALQIAEVGDFVRTKAEFAKFRTRPEFQAWFDEE